MYVSEVMDEKKKRELEELLKSRERELSETKKKVDELKRKRLVRQQVDPSASSKQNQQVSACVHRTR